MNSSLSARSSILRTGISSVLPHSVGAAETRSLQDAPGKSAAGTESSLITLSGSPGEVNLTVIPPDSRTEPITASIFPENSRREVPLYWS